LATLLYSWGLGTKMSLLLALPAIGVVLYLGRGPKGATSLAVLMFQVQVAIAAPFVVKHSKSYVGRAFELSRVFLYKWTVNWRFVGEDFFLSTAFSRGLLVSHVAVLTAFIICRWLKPSGKSLVEVAGDIRDAVVPYIWMSQFPPPGEPVNQVVSRLVTPRYIMTTILTANVVGMLFARSLHYQFYAYLAWATPYLLWRSGMHPVLQYALWGAQEWAWNVFPSTSESSSVVVAVMAVTVLSVWFGAKEEYTPKVLVEKPDSAKE